MKVLKRDKTVEEFKISKIEKAICAAFESCGMKPKSDVLDCVRSTYDESEDSVIDVEDIQDNVERCLMASYPDVAKAYIIYRYQHKLIRENQSKLVKQIKKKLTAEDVQNQNANVDEFSFGGRMGEASRVVTKQYALDYCMSRKSRNNHLNNEIYIHDLDSYAIGMHNCLTIPFDELLANGFKTRQTDIRPANSINTAFQLIAVLFQIQSLQQFGGVAAGHIDWTMVPYLRKSFYKHFTNKYITSQALEEGVDLLKISDKDLVNYKKQKRNEFNEKYGISDETYKIGDFEMPCINFHIDDERIKAINDDWYSEALLSTKNELIQAVEGMYHNLNSLQSRSGNQLPFTSINYGTCTLPEGRMVIKSLLEGSIKGVGEHHLTPIFPCGIFQCMKGINRKEGEPNYDLFKLALQSTSQRIYPNYVNVDWSVNEGYDPKNPRTYTATMGCHASGTKIIMADGTKKNVEDIVVGDKLMGVNGDVRTVNSLINGHDKMFRVNQSNGMSYVVNEYHVLALVYMSDTICVGVSNGGKTNMTLHDFMNLPSDMKDSFRGYSYNYQDPLTKNMVISTLSVEPLEEDDFYGFELDGDKLYMLEDGTVTHNCRTYNGFDINGFGQMKDGRGNLAPVTIILPTLAMEAKDTLKAGENLVEKFKKLLDKKINEAKDMLLERFDRMCKQSPKAASFMWNNNTMFGYDKNEGPISALRHGTLAIGEIALSETLQILIGKDQTTEDGMLLGKEIEGMFKTKCAEFKKEYSLNFGVYYTPAENICYTSFKKFKAKYGDIEGVTYYVQKNGTRKDKEYFTNSIHVPVYKEMSPFEKIDIESQLTSFSNAGSITYVELTSGTKNNIEGLETIVNYAMDKDIPYFAVNVPIDECHDCGYTDEMGDVCLECGSHNVQHLRRVTGR